MLKILGISAAGAALAVGASAAASPSAPPAPTPIPTVSAPASLVGATQHGNTVALFAVNPLSSNNVSFAWDQGYSITGGQPWGGVTGNGQPSINVEAGRSGSTGPAQWFNELTSMPIGDAATTSAGPTELNFAFSGTLTINGTNYPIVLGQGHDAAQNNWWFGGQGSGWKLYTVSPHGVSTPDGLYAISTSDDDAVDQFEVEQIG